LKSKKKEIESNTNSDIEVSPSKSIDISMSSSDSSNTIDQSSDSTISQSFSLSYDNEHVNEDIIDDQFTNYTSNDIIDRDIVINETDQPNQLIDSPINKPINITSNEEYNVNYEFDEYVGFFDETSTAEKGKHRVNDARLFDSNSLHRQTDNNHNGVTIVLGKQRHHSDDDNNTDNNDKVIVLLFDKDQFNELQAYKWWNENCQRYNY